MNVESLLQRKQTTCVRGISVLLIAIFHILLEWGNMPRYINLTGSVCVAAFLFLSGYGIHESFKKNGLNKFGLNVLNVSFSLIHYSSLSLYLLMAILNGMNIFLTLHIFIHLIGL